MKALAKPAFCKPLSFAEYKAKVFASRSLIRGNGKKLRAAITAKDKKTEQAIRQWFLISPDARLYFAHKAAGRVKPVPTPEQCLAVAHNLDLFSGEDEPVKLHLRLKKNGTFRFILNFGHRHRTAQKLLGYLLSQYHRPRAFQFTNRSCKLAIKAAVKRIEAGHLWFAHIDIKEFFPSFRFEKLWQKSALGRVLHYKVLAGFAIARGLNVVVSTSTKTSISVPPTHIHQRARRGIPTGSALSAVVAPYILSRLSISPEVEGQVFNYGDDFLVLAATEADLQAAVDGIRAGIKGLPGGQFISTIKSSGCLADDDINFLGHRITMADGLVRIGVNESNEQSFYSRLNDFSEEQDDFAILPEKSVVKQKAENAKRIMAYVRSWAAAFSLAHDIDEYVAFAEYGIEKELAAYGLPLSTIIGQLPASGFKPKDHFDFSGLT